MVKEWCMEAARRVDPDFQKKRDESWIDLLWTDLLNVHDFRVPRFLIVSGNTLPVRDFLSLSFTEMAQFFDPSFLKDPKKTMQQRLDEVKSGG